MTLLLIAVAAAVVIWLVARGNRTTGTHHPGGSDSAEHGRHRGC